MPTGMTPTIYTLPNGLRVVLLPHQVAPVVAMEVWVGVGSADENSAEAGLAHVHEHMLFKGTSRRGVGEIAREVEAAGGEINARTSFDYTVYHIEMSNRFFEQGLDILGDVVQNPVFEEEELARELDVIVEEIKRAQDSPGYLASQTLFSTAFENHPYRNPVIGTEASVLSYQRDDVLRFFEKWYVPSNMTLVVVGAVEFEAAREAIGKAFGSRPTRATPDRDRIAEPAQQALRVVRLENEMREANLQMAFQIPAITHADVPALDVLSVLLGGGTSSRLEQGIRRRDGFVSSIGTFAYTPRDPGLFTVGATFQDNDAVEPVEVLSRILEEVFQVGIADPDEDEVFRARTLIASQTVYQKQTMRGLAQKFGYYLCTANSLDVEASYYAAISSVTPNDVRRVAAKYFVPDRLTVVLETPVDSSAAALTEAHIADAVTAAYQSAHEQTVPGLASLVVPPPGPGNIVRMELADNLRLLVQEDHSVPLVSLWTSVPGGKRFETDATSGASHLLAQLMTLGTESLQSSEVAASIERMGGAISGYAGNNTIGLSATFLSEHTEAAFSLFSDCLLRPALREEEVVRERTLALQDIRAHDDQLAAVAFRQMTRGLYGEHPYRLQLLGTESSVAALDREVLKQVHEQSVGSQRVIGIVGDIDTRRAAELVLRHFTVPATSNPLVDAPEVVSLTGSQLHIRREAREQVHLVVGFQGTTLDAPDRYALEVLSAVLSGQGGRLFLEIRDRLGLAYSVSAVHRPDQDRGFFAFYAATSPENLQAVTSAVGHEIRRLSEERIHPDELQRARRYLAGTHDVSLQRASTRASSMSLYELYGLGYAHHLDFGSQIMAVDAENVRNAAQKILNLDRAVVSVVLPEDGVFELDWLQSQP